MVRKKWLIPILLIFLILIPTSLLLFQEKEVVKEDIKKEVDIKLQHYRFQDINITSAKKPFSTHLFWELNNGYLLLVDSTSRRDLLISTDKTANWDSFNTGSFSSGKITDDRNIIVGFFDRSNDIIYFIGWETGVDGDKIQCWKLDVSTYTASDIGASIDADNAAGDAIGMDVWIRDSNLEVLLRDDNGGSLRWEVFKWVDPNWTYINFLTQSDVIYFPAVIIGTNAYYVSVLELTHTATVNKWTGVALTTLDGIANVDGPSNDNMLSLSYDGSDVFYFPLYSTGDAENRLFSWSIIGSEETKLASYDIILMLDRNNAGIIPNEYEKGFSVGASETVYEIKARRGGIRQLQNMANITDAVIIAITDNFLMNDDGDMFEFTDVTSEISSISYKGGIIGILKKGEFTVHPDFHTNWSKGDSIKIYDDNDQLEFHGLITDKNRNRRGIYVFKIDSFTNEIYRKTYENSYTADDTDTKQKDVIDNACDFCYRSSSIVGTTTTYDYAYNRAIVYLFWLARFLERQVPYIEPDGKIWTKAYNGLTATGKSWDIEDNSQEVFLIDIPGIEERMQGFFDGNTGITRNTIRYKNNATATRPVAATRDPIEQLQGILPLNEFRDPKIEAATEANQLGDNRYNIFSTDTIFLGLRIEGQGYLQPGKTIEIQNTGQITITQDDFLILWFERDPKNDVYTRIILSDNIIFPSEFTKLQDTTTTQVHTASVQAIENQAAISAVSHPNHNDLNGLNDGDVYEHLSAAQVAALHPIVDYDDALMIGAANAAYVPCAFEVEITPGKVKSSVLISNVDGTDLDLRFLCPLPTNRGGLKLYIDGWNIGVFDADGNNYLDRVRIYGVKFTGATAVDDYPGNITAQTDVIDSFTAIDMSSYSAIVVRVNVFVTGAGLFDLSQVNVHVYYDT